MIENTEYIKDLIEAETDEAIKAELIGIISEDSAGERPGDGTPKAIKELFGDGYYIARNLINDIYPRIPAQVLDLCCGEGEGLEILGVNATGVDIFEREEPVHNIIEDDVTNPGIANDPDVITWLQGIEHFTKKQTRQIFRSIKTHYRPRLTIISTVNKDCDPWVSGSFILTGKYNPYHLNEYDMYEFQELTKHFTGTMFFSQFWDDSIGKSVVVPGLYEDAVNFYLLGAS